MHYATDVEIIKVEFRRNCDCLTRVKLGVSCVGTWLLCVSQRQLRSVWKRWVSARKLAKIMGSGKPVGDSKWCFGNDKDSGWPNKQC